jgi:propanol-preferring alcohol dehydrogenase
VPEALRAVRKGGRVVCGGIHMSDIPKVPYATLWENLTRRNAEEFFPITRKVAVRTHTTTYPLDQVNRALAALRGGRQGPLVPAEAARAEGAEPHRRHLHGR